MTYDIEALRAVFTDPSPPKHKFLRVVRLSDVPSDRNVGLTNGSIAVFPFGYQAPSDVQVVDHTAKGLLFEQSPTASVERRLSGAPPTPCPMCNGTNVRPCSECKGKKRVVCTSCQGTKEMSCPCPNCDGHDCDGCDGEGGWDCEACEKDATESCDHVDPRAKSSELPSIRVGDAVFDARVWDLLMTHATDERVGIHIQPPMLHHTSTSPVTVFGVDWWAVTMPIRAAADQNIVATLPLAEVAP